MPQPTPNKYVMLADTAKDLLGDYSATIAEAEEYQRRLLELHPEFMNGIEQKASTHVRGMVAEYVGVGKKKPHRPDGAPEIKIFRGSADQHERYKIYVTTAVDETPVERDDGSRVDRISPLRERLLAELVTIDRTDIPVESMKRTEQSIVREYLLDGRTEAECALCGTTYDAGYLDASHIKPRSKMSDEERRKAPDTFATLMCPLCHKAFDLGHVTVNESDAIELAEPAAKHRHLGHLEARSVIMNSNQQREQYAGHRKQFDD